MQEQSGLIVHDPENIIITTKEAEAKLDKEDICLLVGEGCGHTGALLACILEYVPWYKDIRCCR